MATIYENISKTWKQCIENIELLRQQYLLELATKIRIEKLIDDSNFFNQHYNELREMLCITLLTMEQYELRIREAMDVTVTFHTEILKKGLFIFPCDGLMSRHPVHERFFIACDKMNHKQCARILYGFHDLGDLKHYEMLPVVSEMNTIMNEIVPIKLNYKNALLSNM